MISLSKDWLSHSKGLNDSLKPNYNERPCPVREYCPVSQPDWLDSVWTGPRLRSFWWRWISVWPSLLFIYISMQLFLTKITKHDFFLNIQSSYFSLYAASMFFFFVFLFVLKQLLNICISVKFEKCVHVERFVRAEKCVKEKKYVLNLLNP